MENVEILQYTTLTLTFLLHLSGLPPCLNMWKTRSTSNVPFYVFILSALNCSGMIYYSMLIEQDSLLYLNLAGFALYVFYIGSYVLCTKDKLTSFLILSSIGVGQLGHFYWVHYVLEEHFKANSLGKLVLAVNVLLVATLAWEVILNLIYKDSKGMPLIMTFSNLLCMTSWLLYGLYLNDFYIYFPNVPGVLVMTIKLFLTYFFCSNGEGEKCS